MKLISWLVRYFYIAANNGIKGDGKTATPYAGLKLLKGHMQ